VTLPAPSEKAQAVRSMFDRICRRYDLMNRLMTLGMDQFWRRRAVDRLRLRPGQLVLDLACGTGDLAAQAASRQTRAVGLDFSSGMLGVARSRRIESAWVCGDAQNLPFGDRTFDAAVSGFALRNFADAGAVLLECGRVLRSGARLAVLEVDEPRAALLRLGHHVYFHRIVPVMGKLIGDHDAYSYLPSSVAYLPTEATLFDMLARAGFGQPAKERLFGGAAQIVTAVRN